MAIEKYNDVLPEPVYNRDHPHYYCYLRDCTLADLKAFAEHRELSIKDDFPATLLVAMLRQDDEKIRAGKGIPCRCCPNSANEDDGHGHYGCEDCPPHYDKKG